MAHVEVSTTLESVLSSTFMWALGIELLLLYPLSYLTTPYKVLPSCFQLHHRVPTISPASLAVGVDGLIGSWR